MGRRLRESLTFLGSKVIESDKANCFNIVASLDTLISRVALQVDRQNTSVFRSETSTS
jgi:hypothetical protein